MDMTDYQSMSQDEADPLISEKDKNGGGEGDTGQSSSEDFVPRAVFEDHFSLESRSDQVRFRTNAVRVFTSGTQQFQIVETPTSLKAKVVRTIVRFSSGFAS